MIAASFSPSIATRLRARLQKAVILVLLLAGPCARADLALVDLRSHGDGPSYFIAFIVVPPRAAGIDPSALVVWGDPKAPGGAYETVGLITTGGGEGAGASSFFGRVADSSVQQMHFEQLAAGAMNPKRVTDALTVLVDEDAFRDAHDVFGSPREGTYFEDQTIAPGDSAARNHGIAQIISYFAGIGSRLGESVPDTLHLASAAGNDPPGLTASFSPGVYLRNMIATAIAERRLSTASGAWSGESFGKWPNGHGQFSYLSGAAYIGEMHRGQRRGSGTWLGVDGLAIIGAFDGDEPTEASVLFPDGDSFSGELHHNRLARGTYQWRGGTRFVGTFGLNEQPVDGTLTGAAGDSVEIRQGLPASGGLPGSLASWPRVDRLAAHSIDFSH